MDEELQNVYSGLGWNPYAGGYRRISDGRKPINARIGPENSRYMGGGLDQFYLQNQFKGMPIWDDPRRPGAPTASGIAQELRNSGMMYHPGSGTMIADTTFNRAQPIWGNQFNPYSRGGFQGNPQGMAPNPNEPARNAQGLTEQQKRWADVASAKAGNGFGEEMAKMQEANRMTTPANGNPYSSSRAQNIENAKAAGEFKAVKDAYNRDAVGSGYRMDDNGTIRRISGMTPQGTSRFAEERLGPIRDEIAARRDFARGEAPVQKMADGTLVKQMGEATMKDHMGRTVPMNPYFAEQAKVQASKFGNMPTDVRGNAINDEEDGDEDKVASNGGASGKRNSGGGGSGKK